MKLIDHVKKFDNLCPHCFPNHCVEQGTFIICGKSNITMSVQPDAEPCSKEDWLECPLNKERVAISHIPLSPEMEADLEYS